MPSASFATCPYAGHEPAVFADTRVAVEETVKAEVLAFNQLILDAISAGDWEGYARLCSPSLTCHEPEAPQGLVTGLDFHERAFEAGAAARAAAAAAGAPVRWTASAMSEPVVTLLGPRAACVAYVRVVTPLGDRF